MENLNLAYPKMIGEYRVDRVVWLVTGDSQMRWNGADLPLNECWLCVLLNWLLQYVMGWHECCWYWFILSSGCCWLTTKPDHCRTDGGWLLDWDISIGQITSSCLARTKVFNVLVDLVYFPLPPQWQSKSTKDVAIWGNKMCAMFNWNTIKLLSRWISASVKWMFVSWQAAPTERRRDEGGRWSSVNKWDFEVVSRFIILHNPLFVTAALSS